MSRTDVHRPWWVLERDPHMRRDFIPHHDHWIREDWDPELRRWRTRRTVPCDLAERLASPGRPHTRCRFDSAEYLQPFLDDDDRIDGLMYPGGIAVDYIEESGWGSDFDTYLTGFVQALGEDWRYWQRLDARKGTAAEWRLKDE